MRVCGAELRFVPPCEKYAKRVIRAVPCSVRICVGNLGPASGPREKEKRMKKLFAVGATAALMLASTSPALALDVVVVGDENVVTTEIEGSDVHFNAVAQNIIGSIGDITQNQFGQADAVAGDANANGEDSIAVGGEAVAEVAQEQDFTFVQFNSALNDF